MRKMIKSIFTLHKSANKYEPHQGKQEKERRRKRNESKR